MRRTVLIWLAIAMVITMARSVSADNWPAWRGDGSGVSSETGLPEQWDTQLNVVWKTPIEGEGISSPVVWQDRIFLTTANQGTHAAASHAVVFATGGALLLLALAALGSLLRSSRRRLDDDPDSRPRGAMRAILLLDRLATTLAVALFVFGLAAILARPDLVDSGSINRAWLLSGVIGMAGLIAAVGLQSPGSLRRATGAAMLIAAALAYHLAVPTTRGANPIELREMLVVSLPLLAAALWNLLVLFTCRRGVTNRSAPAATAVAGLSLLLLAALQFTFLNYLRSGIEFQRSVVAIDRSDGRILWQQPVFVAPRGPKYISNSYATPTPVTDGQRVVVDFGLGLASLDFDGNILWKIEEPNYFDWVRYGAGDSPIMWKGLVIYSFIPEYQGPEIGFGYSENGHLTAVDKATGETRWTTVPPGARDAYNTPLLVRIGNRDALVLLTNKLVIAYDVRTGEEIWRCEVPITQGVPSMVADERRVFAIGGTHGPKGAVGIRLRGRGNITKTHTLWTTNQGVPEVPSPVLYEGLLYMVSDSGIATCLDADDGSRVWRQRLPGRYNASPVAADGMIYFPSVEGTTVVIRAGREFEEISRNVLDEEIMASPAISDGQIFLRTKEHLYCIAAR